VKSLYDCLASDAPRLIVFAIDESLSFLMMSAPMRVEIELLSRRRCRMQAHSIHLCLRIRILGLNRRRSKCGLGYPQRRCATARNTRLAINVSLLCSADINVWARRRECRTGAPAHFELRHKTLRLSSDSLAPILPVQEIRDVGKSNRCLARRSHALAVYGAVPDLRPHDLSG
jgi:hypothetical protein